jgi:hypothetical protein
MSIRPFFGIAATLLLAGCAATLTPELPGDHPANPDSTVAPLPASSQTLAIADREVSDPPKNAASLKPEMSGTHHSMNGMQNTPGMDGMHRDAPATQPGANTTLSAPRWTPATLPTTTSPALYTCKMHPEVVSSTAGKCPKCGMKLVLREGK